MESNKRQRDDSDQDYDPHAARAFDDYDKRQRLDPAQELIDNVCKDIRHLGETADLAQQIDDMLYLLNPIVAEFENMPALRSAVLNTVYAVITEQPHRINVLASLVFICNAKNFVVTRYIIDFLHTRVTSMMLDISSTSNSTTPTPPPTKKDELRLLEDAGPFNNLKSILKFYAALSPIIKDYAVVDCMLQLLDLAIDLQNLNPLARSGIAQEIFYNVLIACPYLFSNDHSPQLVERVNQLVDRAHKFPIVEPQSVLLLQPFDSKLDNYVLPYVPKKMISLVLNAIVDLQTSERLWQDLSRLFLDYSAHALSIIQDALANNPISKELVQHDLAPLQLPAALALAAWQPTGLVDRLWHESSRLLFQVYTNTEFKTVPPIETYFGLFFKDISFDMLTNLLFNKTEAAIQLSELDMYFNADFFAPTGVSIDQLAQIHRDNVGGENSPPLSTFKIEDIAVESILTMIFLLPHPLHYEIYYYAVLIHCCRKNPDLIAPVFGRAIRYFYHNLETLDYELKLRFMDWMTTQISNFEFSWKWDEWVLDLERCLRLHYHPKRNFIKNLIAKEVRLSNPNIIRESFVTIDPETLDQVPLTEFYQYLDAWSHLPESIRRLIQYDCDLYPPHAHPTIEKLFGARQEQWAGKLVMSAEDHIVFNWTNMEMPLASVATKIHVFVVDKWNSNEAFEALCVECIQEIEQVLESRTRAEQFLVNLLFQTYSFVGSRSIYSVVNIVSRDISKLKYATGTPIEYAPNEPAFSDAAVWHVATEQRQQWAVDAIFRIWSHLPQFIYLTLEYLTEYGIIDAELLVRKALDLTSNYIILDVSCMELINRILKLAFELKDSSRLKKLLMLLLNGIADNLNVISRELGVDHDSIIEIVKDVPAEMDDALAHQINRQWLYYEYRGLLKSYIRRFIRNSDIDYPQEIKSVCGRIENVPVCQEVMTWLAEANIE